MTISLVSLSGLFILLGFIAAIRAVSVKSQQVLSLDAVIHPNGKLRAYSESFHAKGLLTCASMNTAINDHLAQFVRGAHSMTAIAVLLLILAAVPTSITAVTGSPEVTRTSIVGSIQVAAPTPRPVTSGQDEIAKLNARVRSLEQQLIALGKNATEHKPIYRGKHPEQTSGQPR
jgi:hypothetical protein